MFDGLPAEQFHQFIASASRASSTSSPLIPPPAASGLSAAFPFHDSASVVFDIHHHHHHHPFANPNPTPPPPPLLPHHHHLLHHPTSSLILLPPPHHKTKDDARHEAEEEEKDRSLLAMSVNFDSPTIDHSPWSNEEVVALLRIGSTIESWFPGSATWEHVSRKLEELGFKRSADKCKDKFEEQTLRSFNHNNNNNNNININFSKSDNNNYGLLVNELQDELYDPRPYHHNPDIVPNDPPDIPPPVPQHQRILGNGSNGLGDDDCEDVEKPMENDGAREDEVVGGGGGDREMNDLEEVDSRPVETASEVSKRRVSSLDKLEEGKAAAKKRKMREERFETFKRFCESVVQRLMAQQEEMHAKLLNDLIRRDREMVEKEEAWKRMEMERVNKELDARAREHATTRDRSAAIIEFLKGFTSPPTLTTLQGPDDDDGDDDTENADEPDDEMPSSVARPSDHDVLTNPPPPAPATTVPPNPRSSATLRSPRPSKITTTSGASDTGKRWPREEVLALINLRCNIQQGNNSGEGGGAIVDQPDHPQVAAKTPLWERISQAMSELGYERSAKRCKEKWENINKYFRKTKDNNVNKKRSMDSRTCPYFHQLNTLYMSQGKLGTAAPEEEPGQTSLPHS